MQTSEPIDPVRSALMAKVRGRDTRPEMVVRRVLRTTGYRYRLHARDLPGRPDITFRGRRKAIFVHGCFWHRHEGCQKASTPNTRRAFWSEKFDRNKARDASNERYLRDAGWDILVIWECETKDHEALSARLTAFIEKAGVES